MMKTRSFSYLLLLIMLLPLRGISQQTVYYDSNGNVDYEASGYQKTDYFYGSSVNNGGMGYTDEEKNTVDNYYHSGKAQRIIQEECQKDPEACSARDVEKNMLAETAAKMYGVVIQGALGGKLDYGASQSAQQEATKAGKTAESEEGTDWCAYAAMGTEMIALSTQTQADQAIMSVPMSEENQQKEALEKVKRTHEERAKTTKTQETGWGVTAGCYVALAAYGMYTGGIMTTAKNVGLRLAASAFLWDYFKKVREEQEARAKKVEDLIAKLPKTGECNPVSERHCFCNEESSKTDANYIKYCMPQAYRQYAATQGDRVSCLDNQMQDDPECKCVSTKTCYDEKFSQMLNKIPNSKAIASQILPAYTHLTNGQLSAGDLAALNNSTQNAVRNKLKELAGKVDQTKKGLNSKQSAMAKLLDKSLPTAFARELALTTLPSKVNAKVAAFKSNQLTPRSLSGNSAVRSNVLRFTGGNGLNKQKKKSRDQASFNLLKKLKKDDNKNSKVMRFSERATRDAQISKRKENNIFDIISRRYKVTSWPLFLE